MGEKPWRTHPSDIIRPYKPHDCNGEDCCPECGEEYERPHIDRCICNKPLMICIPPGKHIHIHCPVHGDVKIYGPRMHWLASKPDFRLSV